MKRPYGFEDVYINSFLSELNSLLEKETFIHCFYDFPRVEIREKNGLYELLEKIKNDENQIKYHYYDDNKYAMKHFCEEASKYLTNYHITSISNIACGKTYKKKNGSAVLMQVNTGYYYSFTVICRKNEEST